jgi:hypothetical protein
LSFAGRALAASCCFALLAGCGVSDDDIAKAAVGTWTSRDVAPDDVIVETRMTLLPGGRVNWQGQLRMLVPADFDLPDRPNFEVKNGRLVYYFTAAGKWSTKDGYLHSQIESSTLPSLMPVGFASAWKIREVTSKEMIYESVAGGRTRVEVRVQ